MDSLPDFAYQWTKFRKFSRATYTVAFLVCWLQHTTTTPVTSNSDMRRSSAISKTSCAIAICCVRPAGLPLTLTVTFVASFWRRAISTWWLVGLTIKQKVKSKKQKAKQKRIFFWFFFSAGFGSWVFLGVPPFFLDLFTERSASFTCWSSPDVCVGLRWRSRWWHFITILFCFLQLPGFSSLEDRRLTHMRRRRCNGKANRTPDLTNPRILAKQSKGLYPFALSSKGFSKYINPTISGFWVKVKNKMLFALRLLHLHHCAKKKLNRNLPLTVGVTSTELQRTISVFSTDTQIRIDNNNKQQQQHWNWNL